MGNSTPACECPDSMHKPLPHTVLVAHDDPMARNARVAFDAPGQVHHSTAAADSTKQDHTERAVFPLSQIMEYNRFVVDTPYGDLLADTGSSGTIVRDASKYTRCVQEGNPQGARSYGLRSNENTVTYCIDEHEVEGQFNGVAYTTHFPHSLLMDSAIDGIMGLAPANPQCSNTNDASMTAIVTEKDCVLLDPDHQEMHIVKDGSCEPLAQQHQLLKDTNGTCTKHAVIRVDEQTLVLDSGFPGGSTRMLNGDLLWGFENMQDKESMFDFEKRTFSQNK
jgi:hypothetical protein